MLPCCGLYAFKKAKQVKHNDLNGEWIMFNNLIIQGSNHRRNVLTEHPAKLCLTVGKQGE